MAEPAWSNVLLHVTADAALEDLSTNAWTLTPTGNAARSTAQAKFGAASIAFDGSGDRLDSNLSVNLGTLSTWTMRLHFRLAALTTGTICELYANANNLIKVTFDSATNKLLFKVRSNGTTHADTSGSCPTLSANTWYHISFGPSAGAYRLWVEGNIVASGGSSFPSGSYAVRFGQDDTGANHLNGYIDEIQLSSETVYVTSPYSPPTGPYAYPITAVATGLLSGGIGTPTNLLTQPATGLNAAPTFGTPLAVFNQTGQASGFVSGAIGTPDLLNKFLDASGFLAPSFGTPSAAVRFRASSIHPGTMFGTPSTPTNRTQIAEGFCTTQFSSDALALAYDPPELDRTFVARWLDARPQWGLAVATTSFTGQATGEMGTAFGEPASLQSFRGDASSIAPATTFGTPGLAQRQPASGFRHTQFGQPKAEMVLSASSIGELTRWGLPAQWGPHRTTGRVHTRIGHPTALQRFNYPATGWAATQFGTPAAVETHKASMIPPGTQFGTPLLVRSPSC